VASGHYGFGGVKRGGSVVGDDAHIAAWLAVNGPFNEGDLGPFLDLLADDVTWWTDAGTIEGKAAAEELVVQGRAAGWQEHRVLSIAANGPLVVSTYVNLSADGSENLGAGVVHFNDAGKIQRMVSLGGAPAELPPEQR
jgi:hypothetical protein